MTYTERAKKMRPYIEKAATNLTDEDALQAVSLFPQWVVEHAYVVGERLQYKNVLYRVVQAHTSQADWKPKNAPSLFAKVLIPDPTIVPEWEQPESTNPYAKGDKVMCEGKKWQSTIDNNVWKPGVYGWEEIS